MAINPYSPARLNGNGSAVDFSFTFPYISQLHIKASLNGVVTTAFTFLSSNIIRFSSAPAMGVAVVIYRETPASTLSTVIQAGGALPVDGLNNNFYQSLYYAQETQYDAANQSTSGLQAQITEATNTANNAITLANAADDFTPTGTGAITRSVNTKLTEYLSISDYSTLAQALAVTSTIDLPPGTFTLYSEVAIPRNGIRIRGAGKGRTILQCASTMATGHGFVLAGRSDCSFEGFTLDGNASSRGLTTASGFNGFNVQGDRNEWKDVAVSNSPLFGILIDGNTITSFYNKILNCLIQLNGGTGLALNKANVCKILENDFFDNGYENLTVDINSIGNIVTNNLFMRYRGGCGNVGWDNSDGGIFSNNVINSESTTTPTAGNRIGFCVNSEAGVTTGLIIADNVIINNQEYGIRLRNRTGQANPGGVPNWAPSKPGDTVITGNYLRNNVTKDIRIEDTDELINLSGNNYQTIEIIDTDAANIRLGAGDAAAEVSRSTTQAVSGNTFTTVAFDTDTALRNITRSGGILSLPCGGFYSIDAKVRVDVLATGITSIQARIVTPSGNREVTAFLPSGSTVIEIDLSISKYMTKGDVRVEVFPFGTGTVNLHTSGSSWLSVVSSG